MAPPPDGLIAPSKNEGNEAYPSGFYGNWGCESKDQKERARLTVSREGIAFNGKSVDRVVKKSNNEIQFADREAKFEMFLGKNNEAFLDEKARGTTGIKESKFFCKKADRPSPSDKPSDKEFYGKWVAVQPKGSTSSADGKEHVLVIGSKGAEFDGEQVRVVPEKSNEIMLRGEKGEANCYLRHTDFMECYGTRAGSHEHKQMGFKRVAEPSDKEFYGKWVEVGKKEKGMEATHKENYLVISEKGAEFDGNEMRMAVEGQDEIVMKNQKEELKCFMKSKSKDFMQCYMMKPGAEGVEGSKGKAVPMGFKRETKKIVLDKDMYGQWDHKFMKGDKEMMSKIYVTPKGVKVDSKFYPKMKVVNSKTVIVYIGGSKELKLFLEAEKVMGVEAVAEKKDGIQATVGKEQQDHVVKYYKVEKTFGKM